MVDFNPSVFGVPTKGTQGASTSTFSVPGSATPTPAPATNPIASPPANRGAPLFAVGNQVAPPKTESGPVREGGYQDALNNGTLAPKIAAFYSSLTT